MNTKGAYDFAAKEAQYRRYTQEQLAYALMDAKETAELMRGWNLASEEWYLDDVHTIAAELRKR